MEENYSNGNQGVTPKKRTTLYIEGKLLSDFKEICNREGESMSKKVQDFMQRYRAVHMKGNPQMLLEPFTEKSKKKCFFCEGLYETVFLVRYISGLEAPTCKTCLEDQKIRTTVKKVLRTII